MLIRKECQQLLQNVKAIPGWFQCMLMVADIDQKKARQVLIMMPTERTNTSTLKNEIRKQFSKINN